MVRASANFMELATDQVLTEILLRLPDARSVIRSSLVCKRWHSLLLQKGNDDYFKNRFVEFHRNTPKHSELLFRVSRTKGGDFHRIPLTLPSESESEAVPCDLSFVPPMNDDPVILLATCGDLALLSRGRDKLFVCNLLTKQCLSLPKIPEEPVRFWWTRSFCGHTIAFNQPSYKVVIVTVIYVHRGQHSFCTLIFHPETSEWKIKTFAFPSENRALIRRGLSSHLQVVVVGGVLYWLDGIEKVYGLASLDLFGVGEGHIIPLPERLRDIKVRTWGFKDKFLLGAVFGRLRMSVMHSDDDSHRRFELSIWELNSDDSSWALVHEAALENNSTESLFFVLSFHPSDKNLIFLVRGKEVFRYNIVKDEYERVSKFPAPNGCKFDEENVARYLNAFSVVHPTWPTPLNSLLQTC